MRQHMPECESEIIPATIGISSGLGTGISFVLVTTVTERSAESCLVVREQARSCNLREPPRADLHREDLDRRSDACDLNLLGPDATWLRFSTPGSWSNRRNMLSSKIAVAC